MVVAVASTVAVVATSGAATPAGVSVTLGAMSGPVSWILLGAELPEYTNDATWDCWKPVVRDTSNTPSKGLPLRDLPCHPCVRTFECVSPTPNEPANLIARVENVWGEVFDITTLKVDGMVAAHATPRAE
eukprot:m.472455 g.472455  ORF g.472455 m.472455 type:complete len:130 (-) comp32730_c0_seq1:152-541(-)